jgi:hypothetical protein
MGQKVPLVNIAMVTRLNMGQKVPLVSMAMVTRLNMEQNVLLAKTTVSRSSVWKETSQCLGNSWVHLPHRYESRKEISGRRKLSKSTTMGFSLQPGLRTKMALGILPMVNVLE